MSDDNFESLLAACCVRLFGENAEPIGLKRLTGGASLECWSFDCGDRPLVLRRVPGGAQRETEVARISIESEARLIKLACAAGVTAPPVMGVLTDDDGLGEGYLMTRIDGETLPHKILGKPEFAAAEDVLATQCAAELAKIHALPIADLPADIPREDAAEQLAAMQQRYIDYGAEVPVFDFTFRWLADNVPGASEKKLLHGDFRMGNLMIDGSGISAVLDWELAHIGDPVRDLAYICTPSWRFTQHHKPVGGFAEVEPFLLAYEEASGGSVDRRRFEYWLVFSTLWWGIACLGMAEIWRSGFDRSLERTVIGRRVSEVEIDLLLLFDPIFGATAQRKIHWDMPEEDAFRGETNAAELLEALASWDTDEVLPQMQGRDLFQARVANNAMGMLRREVTLGPIFAERQANRLAKLGLEFQQLRAGLAEATVSPSDTNVLDHLRLTALERLSIDQPKYPGLTAALDAWSET